MLFISIIAKIICGIILGSIAVKFSNALEEVVKAAICVEYVYDKDNNEWIPYKEENRIWLLHSILVFIFYIFEKIPGWNFWKSIWERRNMNYLCFIFLGAGIIIGIIISLLFLSLSKSGTLRVDESDIDGDTYLFLELDKPVNKSISSKKYVIFKVNRKNYISR